MIIRAITKSKKKVIDRYTVYFGDGMCLTLSSNPNSPQGISQWGEYFGINDADFESGNIQDEIMITWTDLPVSVQAHINRRINDEN